MRVSLIASPTYAGGCLGCKATRIAGTRPSLPVERYAGSYADSLFGAATVRQEGGKLTLYRGTQLGDLVHWHHDVFQVHWRQSLEDPGYVSFVMDPDGNIDELRFPYGPQRYRRVK